MKQKTSLTLSSDLLVEVDRVAGSGISRSGFIEHALRRYFRERARRKINARDVQRINAAADQLNAEAADALEYQVFDDCALVHGACMQRGELYRIPKRGDDRKRQRVFAIVSCQALMETRFSAVVCAPVYTNGQGPIWGRLVQMKG